MIILKKSMSDDMFLLYQKKDKVLPEAVEIFGKPYSINADFKNILRIFDMLDDENIPEHKKICKLREWFFVDDLGEFGEFGEVGENVLGEVVVDAFVGFLTTPSADTPPRRGMGIGTGECERQFCYNFDAEEIYAGFLCDYDIDLIENNMHWYKFKILLANLSPESAFKRKIELRFMDLNDYKDKVNGKKFAELARAKESVQLPERKYERDAEYERDDVGVVPYTMQKIQEIQEIEEFNEIWGKAGN